MTVVLLTGFDPFAGADSNPSWDAVRLVRDGWLHPETLEVARLPVEFERAGIELDALLDRLRPDLVIATGLAEGRSDITPERVAINLADARIPDNAGASPIDAPVVPGGPAAYFSSLPVKAAVAALHAAGVPAAVSQTAGTFVCNAVFYRLQHALAGSAARGGFVHVPASLESARAAPGDSAPVPTIASDVVARALDILIRTCLDTDTDLVLSGGAEH
ncbi:pyroglutamyl-peptidase I [Planctomonas psychrotolerans]|uniref:pyroglutamyl-peptidase I n=1 Tax=Planctomonas psychrotolerans TaxID=2528712 RepID=UPI00123AF920|nr:pyroglutamyl-peptidase I [Planctomonas psychrotolerans]